MDLSGRRACRQGTTGAGSRAINRIYRLYREEALTVRKRRARRPFQLRTSALPFKLPDLRLGSLESRERRVQKMNHKKIVFYELNEVPFRIFDHFASSTPGSSLAKLKRRSRRYETYAEDSGHLSPWVTWPSLHRGVSNDDHQISDFGTNLTHVDHEYPPLWKTLVRHNIKVGMFGSLHTYPLPGDLDNYKFYVPDTFAAGPECFPKKLEPFQRFNLAMAGMNGRNVSGAIALKEAGVFLAASPGLGLRAATMVKVGQQLVAERLNRQRVVRRRTSQVQLAFDFFLKALWQTKPDASFFFTNHVASSMHRYWPALFPADYDRLQFDADWLKAWAGEMPFVMQEAADQLQSLLRFVEAHAGYVLAVSTSMGQAAVQGRERIDRVVTISNLSRLMSGLGVKTGEWEKRPAMVPQYVVRVASPKRENFLENIRALRVNGRSIEARYLGDDVVRLEFGISNQRIESVAYEGRNADPARFGISCLELMDATGANAYHIPNGMLMIYDPMAPEASEQEPQRISTLEVAPSVLRNFGVSVPRYMRAGLAL